MKNILIFSGLILLCIFAYMHFFLALTFVVGAFWSLINLYFLKQLLEEILLKKPKNIMKIMVFTLIKFPLLYGIGFGLLYYKSEFALTLLIGFSASLILNMFRLRKVRVG